MPVLMALVAALCAAPAVLAQQPALLFHASFDDGLSAALAAGDGTATIRKVVPDQTERPVLDEIEMTDGVVGQAVVTETSYLEYPGGANINAEAGTVELWVKPLDWRGDDDLFHVFFTTSKEPGWLILYKYFRTEQDSGISRKLAFYVEGDPGEERLVTRSVPYTAVDWEPGIWHHLAGTWEKGRAALYVDGAMVRERTGGATPVGEFSLLKLGEPWGEEGNRRMALDEVRVYDGPLPADAIRASFAAGLRQLAARAPDELPRPLLVVKALGFPVEKRVAVYVSAAGVPGEPAALRGQLAVVPAAGGAPVATEGLRGFNDAREVFHYLDTTGIAPGDYRLEVTISAAGGDALEASTDYTVPAEPPWWNNELGVTDEVLPPYEPIQVEGMVVRPWGRDYDLTEALILRQVTTHPDPKAQMSELAAGYHRDVPLLAGPIAIAGTVSGREVRFEQASAEITERAPDHVIVRARAQDAAVSLEALTRLEYDGLAQVSLTLTPAGAQTFENMRLEIPLEGEHVTLMNFNSVDGSKQTSFAGAAPAGDGVVWSNTWLPLIWLGDEYRGLCWLNDRDDGWSGDTMQKGRIELVRERGTATLRLNFCPSLADRTDPIALNFCLLATPVRPLPEGWRGLVRDGAVTKPGERDPIDAGIGEPVRFRVWWSHNPGMTQDHGYPVPNQPIEELRRSWTFAEGVADIQHHYPNIITSGKPEAITYYGDWASVSTDDILDQLTLAPPDGGRVDWNTNVVDWWVWQVNELMKLGLDGMYIDDPYIYPSYNERTGGAMRGEDGKVHPSYGMVGLREYFRRMRALAYEHSDWPWVDIHMSGQLMLPFYVFCDSFVNGEHLNLRLSSEQQNYLEVLPLDELKAQYMGYQWGVAPFLLPELGPSKPELAVPTRQILAYFLPHDIYFWRGWCAKGEMDKALRALQHDFRIGEPDNRFLPYWEAAGVIDGQTDTLVCSAHIRPGKVMLVVGNWSTEPAQLDLRLDLAKLGLASFANLTAQDAAGEERFALAGGRLTGEVPARDYRLILLQ